jgi:2-hydroxycyclohexanecarboxyl-CoA dehydrogenase
MTDATRLDGRTAIVTGGAGGIGRGILRVLTQRGARCRIADRVDPAAAVAALAAEGIAGRRPSSAASTSSSIAPAAGSASASSRPPTRTGSPSSIPT